MVQPTPLTGDAAATADIDHHMMGIALTLARRGLGQTAPNPSVGAVLMSPDTGEVLSRAVTAPGGRPHAEPVVIAAAGTRARNATLYVTLEPCSHHGLTAPCADAIVAAGIARVVVAIEDPDPRVAGRGLARLRAAGIDVTRGVRAAEAYAVTRGHICRIAQRRPFVQLKLAVGPDGSVPTGHDGQPTFVTSPEGRAVGHLARAETDAILVGRGTVIADNPDLTCRLPGLADRSPLRVVLSGSDASIAGTRLAGTARATPVLVLTSREALARAAESNAEPDTDFIETEAVITVGGRLWLPAVLERLAERGITRLLVEGGPQIWRSFAEAGLVDEVLIFVGGGAAMSEARHHALLDGVCKSHLGTTWPALGLRLHDLSASRIIGPDRMTALATSAK